ncbi:Soluble lytic murein transglycosylase precursor [Rhodobacteraceae bacterium THAF1]|uniref:lytic transglycosylase domain-containing protein n=1 Tax=Palleronia sp. THAF1 TaxID=2587842 RepID=UPI000F3B8187|nr:lytic transglycosylase domain-containing protein [Palleronia sp. THAF1]VDC17048.1 Soluble lytic murein transglycosylase precursor [Rhodobacteraceae bacterium THAF1]
MRAIVFSVLICLGLPAQAQTPARSGFDDGISAAMEAVRGGRWLAAETAASRAGPVAGDIVDWLWLREGFGDFEAALAFVKRNPDWPGLSGLRANAEQHLPTGDLSEETAGDVLAFFGDATPVTGQGVTALVDAYRVLGRDGDASGTAALAWVERSMTGRAEQRLLKLYPNVLEPLEAERAEQMFWNGSESALARSVERLDGDLAAVVQARLSALRGSDAAAVAEDLDTAQRGDAGLAYRAFRQALARDRDSEAIALLRRQSTEAARLGDPASWGGYREDLARALMREGDYDTAYAVASPHWLTEGSDYAALEWLSGFLALRFLDRPEDALRHFERMRAAVFTPISLGRGHYWVGRAHEALGQEDEAAAAYAAGALHQTSFYGLLAAERIGAGADPDLIDPPEAPPLEEVSFRDSSVLEAALILQAAGERNYAETFFTHLADDLDADEVAALGDLVLSLGEPHIAVRVAKRAAQNGIVIPRAYFPVVDLGLEEMPVSEELALAIARRESEFDPVVSSRVGAGGLMQLMPGTAQDVTRELGIRYSRDRLYADPTYNARLGTAYLAGLERRFGVNPVLVSAGYNAGPGRPLQWMDRRGDPREQDVDVIDWIEMIPFDETRNYVMRVAESLPVYRARLGRPDATIDLTSALKGR